MPPILRGIGWMYPILRRNRSVPAILSRHGRMPAILHRHRRMLLLLLLNAILSSCTRRKGTRILRIHQSRGVLSVDSRELSGVDSQVHGDGVLVHRRHLWMNGRCGNRSRTHQTGQAGHGHRRGGRQKERVDRLAQSGVSLYHGILSSGSGGRLRRRGHGQRRSRGRYNSSFVTLRRGRRLAVVAMMMMTVISVTVAVLPIGGDATGSGTIAIAFVQDAFGQTMPTLDGFSVDVMRLDAASHGRRRFGVKRHVSESAAHLRDGVLHEDAGLDGAELRKVDSEIVVGATLRQTPDKNLLIADVGLRGFGQVMRQRHFAIQCLTIESVRAAFGDPIRLDGMFEGDEGEAARSFRLRVDLDETLGDLAHFVEIIGETLRRCLLRDAAHEDFAVVGEKPVVREEASILRRRRRHGRVGRHGRSLRSGARDGDGRHDRRRRRGALKRRHHVGRVIIETRRQSRLRDRRRGREGARQQEVAVVGRGGDVVDVSGDGNHGHVCR